MEEERRLIFHVDVNSAFLSWTSVKRLREGKSDLRNVPAIISGDPGLRTSIVAAKSIPAAKLGIHTGEASSMAMQKCPELVVAPPDRAWYKECSRRFIAVCRDFTPVLEQASIDECYLDMTGMGKLWPDPLRAAAAIRERVRTELGFTVNVGIAHNKLLAKMASDMEKPDKTHTLSDAGGEAVSGRRTFGGQAAESGHLYDRRSRGLRSGLSFLPSWRQNSAALPRLRKRN